MYGGFKGTEKLSLMRKQQIDTLKVFNDKVIEIVEGTEYRVEFYCNGKLFCVIVSLGVEFPLEKPSLRVEPIVSHPWVDHKGEIVAAPGLLKFSIHSELGRVVQAIIREFELRPPTVVDEEFSNPQNENSRLSPGSQANGDTLVMSILNTLPLSDLASLDKNPQELEEFVLKLPAIVDLDKTISEELTKIESIAVENLEKEAELLSLKSMVSERASLLMQSMDEFQILDVQYKKICEKYNPDSIRETLLNSISKIDEESEKIAENFLKGDLDLDSFLSEYTSHRAVSHSRRFKAENLGQQLRKLHQAGF